MSRTPSIDGSNRRRKPLATGFRRGEPVCHRSVGAGQSICRQPTFRWRQSVGETVRPLQVYVRGMPPKAHVEADHHMSLTNGPPSPGRTAMTRIATPGTRTGLGSEAYVLCLVGGDLFGLIHADVGAAVVAGTAKTQNASGQKLSQGLGWRGPCGARRARRLLVRQPHIDHRPIRFRGMSQAFRQKRQSKCKYLAETTNRNSGRDRGAGPEKSCSLESLTCLHPTHDLGPAWRGRCVPRRRQVNRPCSIPHGTGVGIPSPFHTRRVGLRRRPAPGMRRKSESIRACDEKSRRTARKGKNPAQNGDGEQRGL